VVELGAETRAHVCHQPLVVHLAQKWMRIEDLLMQGQRNCQIQVRREALDEGVHAHYSGLVVVFEGFADVI